MAKQKTATQKPKGQALPMDAAVKVANAVKSQLIKAGHTAVVVQSLTRVSVRVKGHKPNSVLGIVPGVTTQVSCPHFTAKDKGAGTFKQSGGYNIVTAKLDSATLQKLALAGIGRLKKPSA